MKNSELPTSILDAVLDVCGHVFALETLEKQEIDRMVQDPTGAYVSRPEDKARFDSVIEDTLAVGAYLKRLIDGRDLRQLLTTEAKADPRGLGMPGRKSGRSLQTRPTPPPVT